MDEEVRKLVEKEYGFRASSVTPVPSDDTLRKLLSRVADSQASGLSWNRDVHPKFAERLERLGFKLRDGNECWMWAGKPANNGTRPQFEGQQAYLLTIAAFLDAPYETSPAFDVDHRCGRSKCVRPGLGHADPNLRSIHQQAGNQDGVRPRAPAKPKE